MSKPQYYRNREEIVLNELESVDADSLWERKETKMVLVDEDHYVEVNYNASLFYKEEEK